MENKLYKGIGQHVVKCFEAANLAGLEVTCKKLQILVEELASKIGRLSLSNSNLQMEIDNSSESVTDSSPIGPATMSPRPSTAMDIIDQLAS